MKLYISAFYLGVFSSLLLGSCASEHPQYGKNIEIHHFAKRNDSTDIAHTFFLVGDAGNADQSKAQLVLNHLKEKLNKADKNSSLIFLGDNIYPYGMPDEKSPKRKLAEEKLDFQIELSQNFKGKTIFIPGNHDWYSDGIVGLKAQQDYIQTKMNDKNAFLPKNSCGIETKKIGENIALIVIDSEWFLADWNKNMGINQNCDIKTRDDFFSEFEDQLNKNQNKTVVVAVHHPVVDHGSHGGQYSWKKQIFPLENKIPLPVLGTGINLLRATSGITHQDLSNANYIHLSERLQTLAAGRENVIFVSGHDHNLQYSENGMVKQIISGAGSKHEEAGIQYPNDFSYGNSGYAVLKIKNNGDAYVEYFGMENGKEKLLFSKDIIQTEQTTFPNYGYQFPKEMTTSVYPASKTKKSGFYQWLWGKNYRDLYSTAVTAPTLVLDTLHGGAIPVRTGGGHQTHSLRLNTEKGEYVLRGLKKSGVRFLQSVAFKNQNVIDDFQNSFADDFLLDFYTSSNPYTPLAIGTFADALGIKHTDPKLYYVPKQNALEGYNKDFGDELYYLEQRPKEDGENFDKTYSTEEVIRLLAKDEKYKIDTDLYIRARLLDMLIGDWDRHYDQWKWELKKVNNDLLLSPIPKDRDQAFVKYDGFLTRLILKMPALRHMQSFGPKIENIKWFNMEAYPLDLTFTKNATEKNWLEQAALIQEQISESTINSAFDKLPKEVQNEEVTEIKKNLEIRKNDLKKYASDYYKVLQKTVVLTGTMKKERFEVQRLSNGETEVKIFRIKKSGEELEFQKTYSPKNTSEIWMYGLGGEDLYQVKGDGKTPIKIRLIGGRQSDDYQIEKPNNTLVYDDSSGNNKVSGSHAKTRFTRQYPIYTYDYRKPKYNFLTALPNASYNPDDGVMVGMTSIYEIKGFQSPDFQTKHALKTNLFTKTLGYEIGYTGTFSFLNPRWDFSFDTGFSNSKFVKNFYGIGNTTENDKELSEQNYYRVRAQEFHAKPSINWNKNAAHFNVGLLYETIKIEQTQDRFITSGVVLPEVFNTHQFGGFQTAFHYENVNRKVNPGLGMKLDLGFEYKQDLKNSDNKTPKIETGLGFIYHLDPFEKLNLSTYAHAAWLLADDYEFFQMPTLGGNKSLRGFRFDRFYGKSTFYQTTDLRYDLGKIKNYFLPMNLGVFAGFDYGKVWNPQDQDQVWHNSYGIGIFLNALDQLGGQISYFRSSDGGRLVVGLGMDF